MLLGESQLKAIAALTLLSPFVPLLFQGEEWAASTPFLYFTDHENAELGRLVAEGRSKEFSGFRWRGAVPHPQELATFTRSKLEWSELAEWPHAEMLEWYRQLIRLRHTNSRARGKAAVKADPKAGWLRFVHGDLLCAFNFAAAAQRVPMPRGEWELELWSNMKEGKPPREMPAQATVIYRRRAKVDC